MPVTVSELLDSVDLQPQGRILWSEIMCWHSNSNDTYPGVYFVSLSKCPDSNHGTMPTAPICNNAVQNWIDKVERLKIDSHRPNSPDEIVHRLQELWLPDENILYIGCSGSIRRRIRQLYSHEMGDRNHHMGGHWKRLLSNLDNLYIHYADASKQNKYSSTEELKNELLLKFKEKASEYIENSSRVAGCEFPFANRQGPGCRKKHRLSGQVNKIKKCKS